jgi:hypothetical protein
MDGAAVEQLVNLSRNPRELGGFLYHPKDWIVSDPAALVQAGPLAKTLAVSTLGAVRDYLTGNRDQITLSGVSVHVVSPACVQVLGPLDGRARVRETFLSAATADLTDGFLGKFMALEDLLVGLQVRFADVDDRKRVLGLLSNVKHETVKTALDDGMTQVVQAKAGVALISDVAVPNPITLSAFRTFRDILQPSSLYVLRVQSGRLGGLPEVGLFEADGGAWKLTVISKIHDWLTEALPAGTAILA